MGNLNQRQETLARIGDMGVGPRELWLHFFGLGGDADFETLARYLDGTGSLTAHDEAVLDAAVHDLSL